MIKCPVCLSYDVIEWDDGWICRDCGCEFDDPDNRPEDEDGDEL